MFANRLSHSHLPESLFFCAVHAESSLQSIFVPQRCLAGERSLTPRLPRNVRVGPQDHYVEFECRVPQSQTKHCSLMAAEETAAGNFRRGMILPPLQKHVRMAA
jgi:hypothetical protein